MPGNGFVFATHYEPSPTKKVERVTSFDPKMDLSPKKLMPLRMDLSPKLVIAPKISELDKLTKRVLVSPIRGSSTNGDPLVRRIDMRSSSGKRQSSARSRRALIPVKFDPSAPVPVLTETISQDSLTWFNHIDGLFGGMGSKFDSLESQLAAREAECEELRKSSKEAEELRQKLANYDILLANNKRLEGMVDALTGQKQKLKVQVTDLQKKQAEWEARPKGEPIIVVEQDDSKLKQAEWVNKMQRAAFMTKSHELDAQTAQLGRRDSCDAERAAAFAAEEGRLRAEVVKARRQREILAKRAETEMQSMEQEWRADHESEESKIQSLEGCCEKLQNYAKKEHAKYKKEHEMRHKLEMELSAYRNGESNKAKMVLSLHDQLDAELKHSMDVIGSFGKTI
jgi:hypothetical protein